MPNPLCRLAYQHSDMHDSRPVPRLPDALTEQQAHDALRDAQRAAVCAGWVLVQADGCGFTVACGGQTVSVWREAVGEAEQAWTESIA